MVRSGPPFPADSFASCPDAGQSMRADDELPFVTERITSPSRLMLTLEKGSDGAGCTVNVRCGSGLSFANITAENAAARLRNVMKPGFTRTLPPGVGVNWLPCRCTALASELS